MAQTTSTDSLAARKPVVKRLDTDAEARLATAERKCFAELEAVTKSLHDLAQDIDDGVVELDDEDDSVVKHIGNLREHLR